MARPKVDSRLKNIESSLDGIMDKLCEMSPCDVATGDNVIGSQEIESTPEAETSENE